MRREAGPKEDMGNGEKQPRVLVRVQTKPLTEKGRWRKKKVYLGGTKGFMKGLLRQVKKGGETSC